MTELETAPERANKTFFEALISNLEVFGLNAARLILSVTITLAVFSFVLGLIGLAVMGIDYERKTNSTKYSVLSVSYTPHFSNVSLNGRAQNDGDVVTVDRVGAFRKDREQLVSDRLAIMNEAGVCVGTPDQCHDLTFQRQFLTNGFGANPPTGLPSGVPVSFATSLNDFEFSPYYSEFGFGSADDAKQAEWVATSACLNAYKQKNGNLYISKSPILFSAIAMQCHNDYRSAVMAELAKAPADWNASDSFNALMLKSGVAICGVTIILIAMTIILFRLEVSFRSLRNLDRLK